LTYLSSATPGGMVSTLSIWVDEVLWSAVDSFERSGPDDHVYRAREQDGQTVVEFADGVRGARLPTGTANVRAVYRTGSGLAGRVHADQLTLPMSRAGGVTAVTNPAPSDGGDDPETVESARKSAPLRVMTLDRVVSMADYALFARAFPGVAKAHAVWARSGTHRGVLLTVVGNRGEVLASSKGVGANLLTALSTYGDPLVPIRLVPHAPRSFRLAANVRTAPDRVREEVLAAVSARLTSTFSFDRRELGQPVVASEVVAEIQGVDGVVAVTLTKLWKFEPGSSTTVPTGPPEDELVAEQPAPGVDIGLLTGAELIVLDAAPITWGALP
jgi:predicted phage baseplate assembly protein